MSLYICVYVKRVICRVKQFLKKKKKSHDVRMYVSKCLHKIRERERFRMEGMTSVQSCKMREDLGKPEERNRT